MISIFLDNQVLENTITINLSSSHCSRSRLFQVDLDGSNNIDANELRMAFENMQVYLTTEQMEDLVQNFDTDGDRRFDFDEFKAMVKLLIESRNE